MLNRKKTILLCAASVLACSTLIGTTLITAVKAESAQADVSLNVQPVISISATDEIVFNFAPTPDATFKSQNIEVNVSTNNATGYTLYMSANSAETALVNTSISSQKISTISATATPTSMAANTWAYSMDGSEYNPISSSANPINIKESAAPVGNVETTNVTVGVKVDNHLASGAYKNTLLFTAVINGSSGGCPENDIFCITRMQEMTPEICSNTTTPSMSTYGYNYPNKDNDGSHRGDNAYIPEVTLIDTRDNTTYLVRKEADGNCWMSQNLHLKGPLTLTSANTDLNGVSTFTLPASNAIGDQWSDDDTVPHVIEPVNDPQFEGQDGTYWNPQYINYTQPVDTGTPSQHRGNYYTWQAATAGSGSSATGEGTIAASSICPLGWMLPNNSGNQSFANRIAAYGPNPDTVSGSFLFYTPFEMFLFGNYYTHLGTVNSLGYTSSYWTNTASSANSNKSAYSVTFGQNFMYLHYNEKRYNGFSIRCVARPAGN